MRAWSTSTKLRNNSRALPAELSERNDIFFIGQEGHSSACQNKKKSFFDKFYFSEKTKMKSGA